MLLQDRPVIARDPEMQVVQLLDNDPDNCADNDPGDDVRNGFGNGEHQAGDRTGTSPSRLHHHAPPTTGTR
jgi:hypothetical protein